MNLEFPDAETLRGANDYEFDDLPRFAPVRRHRDPPQIGNVERATRSALADIRGLDSLSRGASIALTAGSRGIHDMPAILSAAVNELSERGFEPFIIPAMGSHGGATADGQRETLAAFRITEETMGCPIRSSMAVTAVGDDERGRPVYAADDALDADAVLLVNRIKPHTDFRGSVESGLSKMAVVGLGKHRGAESLHNAALAEDFPEVIRDRAAVLLAETPIVGGIAVIENTADRAAVIEGVEAASISRTRTSTWSRAASPAVERCRSSCRTTRPRCL